MKLGDLAGRFGVQLDPDLAEIDIRGVASLADANPGDLSFFGNPKYIGALRKTRASVVLVPEGFNEPVPPRCVPIENPAGAFAALLPFFTPEPLTFPPGIHPTNARKKRTRRYAARESAIT